MSSLTATKKSRRGPPHGYHKTPAKDGELLLGVQGMIALLGLSKATISRLVRRGAIPNIRIGGRVLFPRAEIVEWINAQKVVPPATDQVARA